MSLPPPGPGSPSILGLVPTPNECHALILYDVVASAVRAMSGIEMLNRRFARHVRVHTGFWRLDLLTAPYWRIQATPDVVRSDLLVVSIERDEAWPPSLAGWFEGCLVEKRGARTSVVGLVGDPGRLPGLDSPPVRWLKQAATKAGHDFLFPNAPAGCAGEGPAEPWAGMALGEGRDVSEGPSDPHPSATDAGCQPGQD